MAGNDLHAAAVLVYGLANPRAQDDAMMRRAMLDAEAHLTGHNSAMLAKATQLGLFEPHHVQRPGIRGGHFWVTRKGEIRYDEPPRRMKPPAAVPTAGVRTKPGELRPLPDSPLIVSYGGGVDSEGAIVEMWKRGIIPDAITFADTGSEHPETYANLFVFQAWLAEHGMPPITVVRYAPKHGQYATLEENSIINQTVPGILLGRKNCSMKWKQEPQLQWAAAQEFVHDAWSAGKPVLRAIGYEAGEEYRSNRPGAMAGQPGETHWYPLQEWGMDREAAKAAISSVGLPVPPKSSCYFCPAAKSHEVLELAAAHPDLAARVIAMEDVARSGKHPLRAFNGMSWDYSWRDMLEADPTVMAALRSIPPAKRFGEVIQFGSGASAPAQFKAFVEAKAPVGVDITRITDTVRPLIADYARLQGRIFVDSGAFGDFRKGRATDWTDVIGRYQHLLDGVDSKNWRRLYMVMPDVIGDQDATLALQAEHAKLIRSWIRGPRKKIGNGIRALMPIQLGKLPPSEVYRRMVAMLKTDDFVALVPSNEKAFSRADLAELLTANPKAIHLAGIAARPEVAELVAMIRARVPYCAITTDANRIAAWVGNDSNSRLLTRALNEKRGLAWLRTLMTVDTERLLDDPLLWRDREVRVFAKYLGEQPGHVKRALGGGKETFQRYLEDIRNRYEGADRGIVDDAIHLAFYEDINPGPALQTQELARIIREVGVGPRGVNLADVAPENEEPLAKARVPVSGRAGALLTEREAINLELWYLREEDLPGANGAARAEAERRKRELEARLARVDYELGRAAGVSG